MKLLEQQVANRILENQSIIMEALAWQIPNVVSLDSRLKEAISKTTEIIDKVRDAE